MAHRNPTRPVSRAQRLAEHVDAALHLLNAHLLTIFWTVYSTIGIIFGAWLASHTTMDWVTVLATTLICSFVAAAAVIAISAGIAIAIRDEIRDAGTRRLHTH